MRSIRTILIVVFFVFPLQALAQSFAAGYDAFEAGDYDTAQKEWTPLAQNGDANAQFNLGWMYNNGAGVSTNGLEAIRWYQMAAENGDMDAQYNLAVIHDLGDGVEENNDEAIRWYRLAAAQGDSQAMLNLAISFHEGDGVEQDNVEAHRWLIQSAKLGDHRAQLLLVRFYNKGFGTLKDNNLAYMWLLIAQENGAEVNWLARQILRVAISDQARQEAQNRASRCVESGYEECD